MSGHRLEWGQVKRYFLTRGYVIYADGGDKLIYAPKDMDHRRRRQVVRIGHKFSTRDNDELLDVHVTRIKLAFGVTKQMILGNLD
jgi:hypothetical protein